MKQVFTKLGILDRVKFWLVDKHPKGGIYGCFESHFNVWSKHGIKDYLCIFEDDIDGDPAIFHDTIKNLPNLDAMVINIGPSPLYITESYGYGFDRGYFLDTAAYIIPRKHLPMVIQHVKPYFGIPVDVAMFDLPSIGKRVFHQIESPSDIGSYSAWWKEMRESTSITFPGFGHALVNIFKYTRSDPGYRSNECPGEIVDRR